MMNKIKHAWIKQLSTSDANQMYQERICSLLASAVATYFKLFVSSGIQLTFIFFFFSQIQWIAFPVAACIFFRFVDTFFFFYLLDSNEYYRQVQPTSIGQCLAYRAMSVFLLQFYFFCLCHSSF